MTPEEMELARSLLASVQNTTVQGWDILVRGTVISNAINLVTITLTLFLSFGVAWHGYRHDDSIDAGTNAFLTFVLVGFLCLIALYVLAGDALVGVFAPEYSLLNNLINRAGCGQ